MDAMTLAVNLTVNTSGVDTALTALAADGDGKIAAQGVALGNIYSAAFQRTVSAAVRAVKDTMTTGMNFDYAMAEAKKVSGASEEQFERIRERAQELGRTTAFTATEVANAFYYMGVAGWDSEQMLQGIDGVLSLAAASGEDLATTSDIVTDALTAFGLKAEDAAWFCDTLAATAVNANTTVGLMGGTFKYVAANAGAMHISAQDTAEAIGLIANAGIKGTQAGTSLSNIISRIAVDAGASKNQFGALGIIMNKLGVDVYDQTGQFRDFGDILNECRVAWAGLTDDQEKATYAKQIAGQRAISSWYALMNASEEDINKLHQSIEDSKGAAKTMADIQLDNLKGDITIMNSAIEGLQILVSDRYKDSFRSFVQFMTDEVGNLSAAFEEGGLAGMFVNLTNWIIDGITDTLSNPEITVEGATDFGEALGTFVGNLITKLVTSTPDIVAGLFTAGLSLADGLVQGLFAGLFGIGDGTVWGAMQQAGETRDDLIADANETAVKAEGIVGYMEGLVRQYGEAAGQSKEWAQALESLNELIPGITSHINAEGQALSDVTGNIRDYIEQSKAMAIEKAKEAYYGDLLQQYNTALIRQGEYETYRDLAQSTMGVSAELMAEYASRSGAATKEGLLKQYNEGTVSFDQLTDMAYATANELGTSTEEIKAAEDAFKDAQKSYGDNVAKLNALSSSIVSLQEQVSIAAAAVASMAAAASSFSVPSVNMSSGEYYAWYYSGKHAAGLWSVPRDNYRAVLHRDEMVLTASQARQYRSGLAGGLTADEVANIARAAVSDLTMELNGENLGRMVGDATTSRVSNNMAQANRRRVYGYGG